MKKIFLFIAATIFLMPVTGALAQDTGGPPPPPVTPAPTPPVSEALARRLDELGTKLAVTRERRETALAKLMEGQRYAWAASRTRSSSRAGNAIRSGRRAFREAVESDPSLAEGYTALAELEISQSPGDAEVDESIALAKLAVRVGPNNFGARRLMARLYSYKSRIGASEFNTEFARLAEAEWRQVSRLDPRNAEAWGFLSAIYGRLGKEEERIDALRKWVGSATPIDTQVFRLVLGPQESLSPENATLKLASALIANEQIGEAIGVLSAVIADNADNAVAIQLLTDAVESAEGETAASAIEALQQAAYATPDNVALVGLLARIYLRTGRPEEAVRLYEAAVGRTVSADRPVAAVLQVGLGDFYSDQGDHSSAVAAFEKAIEIRGLSAAQALADDERIFLVQVFEKLIQEHSRNENEAGILEVVDRARKLFGAEDAFADRQLITYYRDSGRRTEALAAVRRVRQRHPDDFGFVRLEATLLTESGRVDEAVAIVKKHSETGGSTGSGRGSASTLDEFSNLLFISNLYTQADRPAEAAAAANQALEAARGTERKQIALLTLATAQNLSGDFVAAEKTLRDILKESPNNPIALNNLGYFLVERGERLDEAKKMIEEAVRVDPTNPSYLDSLGWANYKLGIYAEAERLLKEAVRFDPSSSTIHDHLGDVYAKQNRFDLAKASWERALKLASIPADIARISAKLK